jgi:hypothetical protein
LKIPPQQLRNYFVKLNWQRKLINSDANVEFCLLNGIWIFFNFYIGNYTVPGWHLDLFLFRLPFFFFFFSILASTNVGLQGYVSPYVMDDGFEFKYSSPHQVLQEIWKIDEFSVGIWINYLDTVWECGDIFLNFYLKKIN